MSDRPARVALNDIHREVGRMLEMIETGRSEDVHAPCPICGAFFDAECMSDDHAVDRGRLASALTEAQQGSPFGTPPVDDLRLAVIRALIAQLDSPDARNVCLPCDGFLCVVEAFEPCGDTTHQSVCPNRVADGGEYYRYLQRQAASRTYSWQSAFAVPPAV